MRSVQTIFDLRTLCSKGFVFATLRGELNRAGTIIGRSCGLPNLQMISPKVDGPRAGPERCLPSGRQSLD